MAERVEVTGNIVVHHPAKLDDLRAKLTGHQLSHVDTRTMQAHCTCGEVYGPYGTKGSLNKLQDHIDRERARP